jgi:hypothetical protein
MLMQPPNAVLLNPLGEVAIMTSAHVDLHRKNGERNSTGGLDMRFSLSNASVRLIIASTV